MKIRIDDDYGDGAGEKAVACNEYEDNVITCDTYETAKPNEADVDSIHGKITVVSRLGSSNGVFIKSSKINLYMLNGISPKLISSKYTDEDGRVVFRNLEKGSYRVIAIVDRKYFEKPTYIQWNEVNIDINKQEESILVINKLKHNINKK